MSFHIPILQFYGNTESVYYLFTDNQAAEHLAIQPNLNEHGRTIDTRHHEVRQDYLDGKVQIGGVKITANPSDILTKFLPAPSHQEHSKYLNLTPPKPYTQNGNFIRTTNNLTSTKCSGQSILHKVCQARITAMRQKRQSNIGQKLLPPINYTTKRQRQKQRQQLWTAIHTLRRQKPHLAIEPKQKRTNSRCPEYRHAAEQPQASTRHSAPRRIQNPRNPPQPTTTHPEDLRILHANRQHPELQARRQQNPIHQHPVRRRTPDHDLHTPKGFTRQQQRRIRKWVNTLTTTDKTEQDPYRRSHPFHPPHNDPSHASSSHTSYKYKRTFYRQTQSNKKQDIQTKMTARQNTYNSSHKRPKEKRSKQSETKHEEQSNQPTRRPKFKRKHPHPISLTVASRTFPRTPIQNNEIKKATRGGILNQMTNHSRFIKKPKKNDFSTNQNISNATRQMFKSTNTASTSHMTFDKTSNQNLSPSTIKIDLYNKNHTDNVFIVKQQQTQRRRGKRVQGIHTRMHVCVQRPTKFPLHLPLPATIPENNNDNEI
jgi:hypothetical protein